MLKYIVLFYQLLAGLSLIGGFILMANSTAPLLYAVSGVLSFSVLLSVAIIIEQVKNHLEYQSKVLKRLVKGRNG